VAVYPASAVRARLTTTVVVGLPSAGLATSSDDPPLQHRQESDQMSDTAIPPARPGRTHRLLALGSIAVFALAACSQQPAATSSPSAGASVTQSIAPSAEPSASAAASAAAVPAPFDNPPVKIALVRQLGSGDYFEQWLGGAQDQADALGIELLVSDARGDNAAQSSNLETAVNQGVAAIIVDHGQTEPLEPGVTAALASDIPVVAFDVNVDQAAVPQIEQSDATLAKLALDQLVADTGGEGTIAYAYVAGFAPLDRRDAVFQEVLTANPGLDLVATFGTVSDSTAAETQSQAAAVLTANPDITAIFAPYDEFAKGAVLAIEAAGLQDKVKVYGADISTADIGVMIAENSPWVATAGTDPANVGRVAVRAAALLAAGETVPHRIVVEPALITQQFLRDNAITTIEELGAKLPALDTPDLVTAPWFDALGGQ
jgi:simple sugar transport system substrate-binding protein